MNKTIIFGKVEGNSKSKFKNLKIVLTGFGNTASLKMGSNANAVTDEFVSFLKPISKFDPQGNSNQREGYKGKTLMLKNESSEFVLGYE